MISPDFAGVGCFEPAILHELILAGQLCSTAGLVGVLAACGQDGGRSFLKMGKSKISPFFRPGKSLAADSDSNPRGLIQKAIGRIIRDGRKLDQLEPQKGHYKNAVDFAKSLFYNET